MKIRSGFVSNSSSSSFIIYTGNMSLENKKGLINYLNDLLSDAESGDDEDLTEEWGDSGRNFEINGNFIDIETYYLKQDVLKKIFSFVPKGDSYSADH